MDFYKSVLNRASVRNYDTSKPIRKEDYKKLIDAIKLAPTSSNWHSSSAIVIRDKKQLKQIASLSKYTGAIESCDMFVVFLADYNRMNFAMKEYPEFEYNNHSIESYTVGVGDAFIQATMLQDMAINLGYGTCFIGLVRAMTKELIGALNIKGQAFPVIGLTIGSKKEEPEVKPKLNRVFDGVYEIDKLEKDAKEYSDKIEKYYAKLNPDKPAWPYLKATIKSASSYQMQTEEVEKIWDIDLITKK
ncbi:nitroreductase family protein [Mycoplasma sp. Mirounga ES2805-ORL]|uniref:nitroreductase family protein n=1 Tax=Mycoplasma sp. Mirounga ES2805-ORL TaxID=754514 RepID=UPI00197C2A07|nr:nitroreductase family protein [Mycoplasma sp. Mirounga ES2805-ORL]QSF13716.1 nitroreductase family protein [Mycoplasma sp. Mirounga ES2805-ORL]